MDGYAAPCDKKLTDSLSRIKERLSWRGSGFARQPRSNALPGGGVKKRGKALLIISALQSTYDKIKSTILWIGVNGIFIFV